MTQTRPLKIWETPLFLKWAARVWSGDEKASFMDYIAKNPTVGTVVPGSGGVRKIRWAVAGRGKSFGVRVIYYYASDNYPLYLIYGYSKSEKADLSHGDLKSLKEAVARIKKSWSTQP